MVVNEGKEKENMLRNGKISKIGLIVRLVHLENERFFFDLLQDS